MAHDVESVLCGGFIANKRSVGATPLGRHGELVVATMRVTTTTLASLSDLNPLPTRSSVSNPPWGPLECPYG